MKKAFVLLSFIMPSISYACPSLEGTWSSSLEKFKTFNQHWVNVEDKPWSYMLQTQGHEQIIYSNDQVMTVTTPTIKLKMGGKVIKLPTSTEQISYKVLGCTDSSLVMQYKRYGKTEISQLHFENNYTYWVYMGSAESDDNSHIREYYTRNQ